MSDLLIPGTSRQAVTVEESRLFGYGAVFYRDGEPGTEYYLWDDIVERIMPGAFDRAIAEDDVIASFNHNPDFVLGRNRAGTLALSIDDKGLRYDVTPSESMMTQHVVEAVKRGDVPGSSFMFHVSRSTWIETKTADGKDLFIREVQEVNPLMELGPVMFPAYASTTAEANMRSVRTDVGTPGPFRSWLEAHCRDARKSLTEWTGERQNEQHKVAEAKAARCRARRRLELLLK